MNRKLIVFIFVLIIGLTLGGYLLIKSNSSKSTLATKQNENTVPTGASLNNQSNPVPITEADITTQTQLPAITTTQIELILDDSGSMAGLVGGQAKIDIAKESINKIIDQLNSKSNLQVALRIYGHQNKECTNSVTEIPMGQINSVLMKSKIKDLLPLGYTPIYYSLTESVKDFKKDIPGDKVVVLVTDGLESCNGDPCAAARALKAGGVINKMQIIGFGLNKTELSTLQCIVDPFKGQVMGANNSTEFLKDIQQIMDQAINIPNLNISVVGSNSKPLQASDICVYTQGQTENPISCAGMFTADYGFTLKPGVYDIKATNGKTSAEVWLKNIKIEANKITNKIVSFDQGNLKIAVKGTDGQPLEVSDICIYLQGQTETPYSCAGMFTAQYDFNLKPGIYDVKATNSDTKEDSWLKNIEITASQTISKEISFSQGSLKVSVVTQAGDSTQASNICVYSPGQTENPISCAGMFTADYEFKLKSGIYDLKVTNYDGTSDKWTKNIDIKAYQTVTQKIVL